MYKSTKQLSILAAVLLISGVCMAGEHRWTNAGLQGANVTDLVVHPGDPSVLFIATNSAGIFRSLDNAGTWNAINSGIDDRRITSLAVDAATPTVIYAGTWGGQLLKTVNAGQSWTEAHKFVGAVHTVITDSGNHRVYVGTVDSVFFSKDGGSSWTKGAGIIATPILSLAINPVDSSNLLAGTGGGGFAAGLYRTMDGGRNWIRIRETISPIRAIAFDPLDPKRVYLATQDEFLTSHNSGESWESFVHGTNSWGKMEFVAAPQHGGTVYVTTARGIYRTENSGANWVQLQELRGREITALANDNIKMGGMYAASSTGVYRSADGAATWTARNAGLTTPPVFKIALAPTNPSLIYASTADGVFKTSDAGTNWELSNPELQSADTIEVDPVTPTTAFAASSAGGFKTTDEGKSWTRIEPSGDIKAYINEFVIDPSKPSTVYAALYDSGIAKSMDSGDTWSFINYGLPPAYYGFNTYSFAVDPSNPSTLFASTMGISRSTDAGASWNRVTAGPDAPNWWVTPEVIAVAPGDSSHVYGAGWSGVYRSVDGGEHWTFLRQRGPDGGVRDMVLDPREPSTIYLGTEDRGILRSSDRGETWISFNEGLESKLIHSLAIDASGKFLVAATNEGVFSFQIPADLPPDLHGARLADDATRLPRLMDQIRESDKSPEDAISAAFVMPAAGYVTGMGGTKFRSDVTLISRSGTAQPVIVAWLIAGADGTTAPTFQMTLPAAGVTVSDFIDKLGFSGLGALLVIAVDAEGKLDPDASIDGFSRIWTAGCNGIGTVSESLPALPIQTGSERPERLAIGLRHEAGFRLNLGIVNLDSQPRAFSIDLIGERETTTQQATVPALSILQAPVQQGDHGAVTAVFRAATTGFLWAGYGSSVDNTSGDAWASTAK